MPSWRCAGCRSDDPVREDVAHCVVVTAAVFDLVDQLDGSDRSPTLIAVNLDNAVNSMRRLLDALLPPSIEMHMEPDSDGAYVPISKLRVERIVLNLVLNARDAMDEGGKVSITTRRGEDGIAQIVVADTGPGFSDEALAHLFEVGFTTKRERGGSGHGLSALTVFVTGVGGTHRGRFEGWRGCHHRRQPAGGRSRGHAAGGDLEASGSSSPPCAILAP